MVRDAAAPLAECPVAVDRRDPAFCRLPLDIPERVVALCFDDEVALGSRLEPHDEVGVVVIRTARDLMRHSTIAMTGDVYACTVRGTMNVAVRKMPSWAAQRNEPAHATGTLDSSHSALPLCLARRDTLHSASVRDGSRNLQTDEGAQSLRKTGTCDASPRTAAQENAGRFTPHSLPPRGFEPLSPA